MDENILMVLIQFVRTTHRMGFLVEMLLGVP